eukprot:TRINITY_DN9955_c1_g1_i2.p1 TRINITY_DN9955_c1_g1~~TRINITY_DN9955_c1_g1_i2.p1  ORF type:complete len:129 (-),score=19.39 TRINITY_DN9955_c1_g1_i2:159-545(-)
MRVENCISTLALFDKYALPKGPLLAYIANKFQHVVGQQEFLDLSATSIGLVSEVYQAYRVRQGLPKTDLKVPLQNHRPLNKMVRSRDSNGDDDDDDNDDKNGNKNDKEGGSATTEKGKEKKKKQRQRK